MAFKLSGLGSSLSYEDLLREWDWCFIAQDAEAAAELGRTLLERNRELESTIRQQQIVIDDQAQEMQHWRKQNRGLRQASDSRLRLCEQLESAAAESERTKTLLRQQIENEQRRYTILKKNLEAAEERGDELQRLLDSSRASENQALSMLRSLQLQNQRNSAEADETAIRPSSAPAKVPLPPTPPSVNVSRLMEDLAEMEERLLTVESDWMEEKRKRMQLETEIVHLNRENHRLQEDSMAILQSSGTNSSCTASYAETSTAVSLSLSEELLLSSGDYVSHTTSQWNEAWDHSGPLSLIGGPASGETRNKLDEELGSESSSSGFSEAGIQQHKSTQTGETENPVPEEDVQQDYKSIFKEIFAVIKQNL